MSRVGDVLASKYRLEELLGSGGMGHVYRATNELVGRAVAIKVLREEHATNPNIVDRFLREARAANLVRHPNVVDVLDVGRDEGGSPFIVQELLEGQDLQRYVESRGGKLTLEEVESLVLPVIDAVATAHARGVVHRDLKPENVFLATDGKRRVPKLLDFGISKVQSPNVRVTEVGAMLGTPAYMAPEQIQHARDADARTDVWALGIILFELLSGRLPFAISDAPALFVAIATKDVPDLVSVAPFVDPTISRVVGRCLRRVPAERYPSALELARDLRHVLAGSEIEPTQRLSIRPPPRDPGAALDIPDLDLPGSPRGPHAPRAADATISGPPPSLALKNTELSDPGEPRIPRAAPPSVPDLPLGRPAPPPAGPAPPASARLPVAAPAASPSARVPVAAPPPSAPYPPHNGPMPGVMMGPSSQPMPQRRAADREARPPAQPVADMSVLVGLAVVGLSAIGATAVLMTFAHQPEGLAVAAFLTRPTPILNLVVNGGLGVAALILAGRSAMGGLAKWRGDVSGGRTAAIVQAIVGGAFLFAAIELARAAF